MARGHAGLPRAERRVFKKSELLAALRAVDADAGSTARVLALENEFRRRVQIHVDSLPAEDAKFEKFNTSPFVLMIHCMINGYSRISQIESDILPAKQFSSMETSAGRMVEAVALPAYGWEVVLSEMHSANSALDGKQLSGDTLRLATLKSGPRCLNDEMSENLADSIISRYRAWATDAGVRKIDFTYGVLYGTPKISNKKDWHILRNIGEKMPAGSMTVTPDGRWDCAFTRDGIEVKVAVRIGLDWWVHLGGSICLTEICAAMIRACVRPGDADPTTQTYAISDLAQIVSTAGVLSDFNVAVLQRSQLAWLFFLARHFCDTLEEA
ncbi:MAG: hypothetical protein IPK69_01870 [Phycisphaerales bacterium]|nr:MAG: hypothetical protein IPK69_01870 [Phycisphaerales bacterium]